MWVSYTPAIADLVSLIGLFLIKTADTRVCVHEVHVHVVHRRRWGTFIAMSSTMVDCLRPSL